MSRLIDVITSSDDAIRNQSLHELCCDQNLESLLSQLDELDQFWRESGNLYHRVRALFFASAIHRYYLTAQFTTEQAGLIPFDAYQHLLQRRFVEAIDDLLQVQAANGPSPGISSALASAYHELGFQTLANQVRRSVRTVKGNQWMFRVGHPADHPLRLNRELLNKTPSGLFPILSEKTSVRMDFSHSGWSDIFFLGMDYPAGARVINASIDLAVCGRDDAPRPPIETYLRVIDRPVLRLSSTDLGAQAEIETLGEVFDFARDYLGLLKAAVIASGIIPPGLEGCEQPISDVMARLIGRPDCGLEIVSNVNDIPKGSRLAVSTNLLGSLISICMRATGQVRALTGGLVESDRRLVAARAILGEWIGGSGGGWQDSGGVWPGIKLIEGAEAGEDDPEFGVSRGRLLPNHVVFSEDEISTETRQRLQESLVLVHGGMAQNVGPILEMVTERYLLRSPEEWSARADAIKVLDEITEALKAGDVKGIGTATNRNFFGPLQSIIPWCTNLYTNRLVEQCKEKFGDQFWGFWMLGGMAGGGMGFIFDPTRKAGAQEWLGKTMLETKSQLEFALPFAMDPVVYDFSINDRGSWCELLDGCDDQHKTQMPSRYYEMATPNWLRSSFDQLSEQTKIELEQLGRSVHEDDSPHLAQQLIGRILPKPVDDGESTGSLDELLEEQGFDHELHEQIQRDLKSGRYGLAQNRLTPSTKINDVSPESVVDTRAGVESRLVDIGKRAIANGEIGVMTLAAGVGSRWTEGAGVVKALHPFCKFSGQHRSFLELHLAKSRRTGKEGSNAVPHVFTTGYMTHRPISEYLERFKNFGYDGPVYLSPGKSVGLRTIPMVRDLLFAWNKVSQQVLDEQQQKVRDSLRSALIGWAKSAGEGSDYRDNLPMQCLHPVGHWYEFPNMLRNGVLSKMLSEQKNLKYLMLHNVDTVGANLDPGLLGLHIDSGNCLSFEVINRRLDDRGGGLANVDGRVRLLEGLAMPREEDEFLLSFYNSMTTWIDVDQLLTVFGLNRSALADREKVDKAVRELSQRMPTYVTIKDVKKRWGHGQEDVFPVTQFEKLWSDMSGLAEIDCGFFVVSQQRGQQLKEQSQLDSWLRDGTAERVNALCQW